MFCELHRLRHVAIAVIFTIVGITLHEIINQSIFWLIPDLDATKGATQNLYRPQPLKSKSDMSTNMTDSIFTDRNVPSYVCTDDEMLFQYQNYELVDSHICDSDHPWKLAQMFFPSASVFIDVGANVGFTAAKFFGLWSPGTGFNRRELVRLIKLDALATDHRNEKTHTIDTVCGDGQQDDKPLLCHGQCQYRRSMHVYSFDGQTFHWNNTARVVHQRFPHLNPAYAAAHPVSAEDSSIKQSFEYMNMALTDKVPGPNTFGYFKQRTDEGGSLDKGSKLITVNMNDKSAKQEKKDHILIQVSTIDQWCDERRISVVDFLKVDAEGHDDRVLQGAWKTIQTRQVKMISVEIDSVLKNEWREMVHKLDQDAGFDCYTNGKLNTFLRITKCLDKDIIQKALDNDKHKLPHCPMAKDRTEANCPEFIRFGDSVISGNMYCIHRTRAQGLNALFQQHSLYQFQGLRRGHVIRDALLGLPGSVSFNESNGHFVFSNNPEHLGQWTRYFGRDTSTGERKFSNNVF